MGRLAETVIGWLIFSLIFTLAITFLGFEGDFRKTFTVSFLTLVVSSLVTWILAYSIRRKR
ncbi:hypothetical protein DRO69_05995 [Candidatus Bathyarchaeota archaeon]|nr:MAG: hypothetical protein DRO69_05995 [Candidatus Bathyarchaeota archaeon]